MDYTKYSDISYAMNSFAALKEAIFKTNPSARIHSTFVGNGIPIIQPRTISSLSRFSFSEEVESEDGIKIGIANEPKFITFIKLIRHKRSTNAVMYIDDDKLVVFIRPNSTPPFLIMNFPLSNPNVYCSCAENICFEIPLSSIDMASSGSDNSYAFYFKEVITDMKFKSYELIYKTGSAKQRIKQIQTLPFSYINQMLRLMVVRDINDTSMVVMDNSMIEHQHSNLNDISILVLDRIEQNSEFPEFDSLPTEKRINITFTLSTMKFEEIDEMSSIEKEVTNSTNALIWKIQQNEEYSVVDRSVLLKISYQNSILSSDSKYRAFGTYGTSFVYIKIISDKPAIIESRVGIHKLSRMFDDSKLIVEIYFCKKI